MNLLYYSILCLTLAQLLLSYHCQCQELQGPNFGPNIVEAATSKEDNSKTKTTTANSAEAISEDESSSNERKSSRYVEAVSASKDSSTTTSQSLVSKLNEGHKAMHAALLKNFMNEQLTKQKLKEQIEEIESRRKIEQPIDPTPQEIEGNFYYFFDKFIFNFNF